MKLRVTTDRAFGIVCCAMAAAGIGLSSQLSFGSAARMGPGFFPMNLSILLLGFGIIILGRAWFNPGPMIGEIALRPVLTILAGVVLFGAVLDQVGFLIAAALMMLVSRLAIQPFKPLETALLAAGLIALSACVFILALKMPIRLLPV